MEQNTGDLVNRILAGDRTAEEKLVEKYYAAVSAIIRHRCGNRFVVDDLIQETFLTVITKIRQGELRVPKALPGFICRIARNLTIMDGRRRTRNGNHEDIDGAKTIATVAPTPLDHVLRKEHAQFVRRVLSEVTPEIYQQVLFRYYIAEEDKDGICADLGLASLQFNQLISRARKRFEELYRERLSQP